MNWALAAAYAHGPGKEIKVGPAPSPESAPGVRFALPATDVARLLVEVLSPSRWEPWNQYNDHRSYPSPRAAYLVDVEIVVGGERWLFDPLRRATIAQPSDPRTNGPLAPTHPPQTSSHPLPPIEWSRDAPRVGWGNVYVGLGQGQHSVGSVGPELPQAQHDVGLVKPRLPQTEHGVGAVEPLLPQTQHHPASAEPKLAQGQHGTRSAEPELAQAQHDVASVKPELAQDGVGASGPRLGQRGVGEGGPALDRAVRLDFVRRPDRLSAGYGQFAEALTELEVGHVAGALVENAPRFGLRAYADGDGVTLEPDDFRKPGKMAKRSSGLGPRGLAADPRPLPIETLTSFIKAMEHLPDGTLRHPALQHRLAVHNVAGARDGWYTVDVRRTGPAMEAVQDCHGHPQAVIDVSGMNLALVMAADVPAAVKAGEGEYQALLRAAGALGQHVCTAAAEAGMFCRPLRSFDDPALEAAAGFPLSHSLLYVLLAGRPKVTGPAYDLSPLEVP